MKIYFCGFMGSGKSYLRARLTEQVDSHWESFDFDDELYERFGRESRDLGEVIENLGWENFRRFEMNLLKETLLTDKSGLYSLGGGTLDGGNDSLLENSIKSKLVWVKTDPELCWRRVKFDRSRPLVSEGKEAFFELYERRLAVYEKADFVLEQKEQESVLLETLVKSLENL